MWKSKQFHNPNVMQVHHLAPCWLRLLQRLKTVRYSHVMSRNTLWSCGLDVVNLIINGTHAPFSYHIIDSSVINLKY